MWSENIIVTKSLKFAIEVIRYCELLDEYRKYDLAKQLRRSGTSVGANIFESQHAESRVDFIHKMKIAIKEANETFYWLSVCEGLETYPQNSSLKKMIEEIIRILSRIIYSSKTKLAVK